MGIGWKNFEKHHLKSLGCLKQIVGRNIDTEGTPGKSSEGSERHNRESLYYFREYICHREQKTGKNTNIKGASGENSEGNEKCY